MMTTQPHELEDAVIDAWPPAEYEELDGWGLRASGGPTKRGNSVATLGAGSALSLHDRIARAEAFYRERELPAIFQVGPAATPAGLDAELEARGYRVVGAAVAAIADPSEVLARVARTQHETSLATSASEAWLAHAGHTSRFRDAYEVFTATLARLGTRCRFVSARNAKGTIVGTCLGITSEDRLGIYSMLTTPELRRKGVAKSLLRALAECALSERMRELYLLVEEENAVARAFYAQAGFQDLFRYHYRVQD
jgi:GNAT superfamily N-acetyltransferase